jgi:hypothetical protein
MSAVSELACFPFTATLRGRIRGVLFLMVAITCGLALVVEEQAIYVLAAFFVMCDVPVELVFYIVRGRRVAAHSNGEDRVGIVIGKRAFLIGPQHAVIIRYSVEGTVIESSRQIPLAAWLQVRIGEPVEIRVDREHPRNWVFCWADSGDGTPRLCRSAEEGPNSLPHDAKDSSM